MAPTASYNIYDDEVNELDRDCSGNGGDAGSEVNTGTPVRDCQHSFPTALEDETGTGREGYIYFLETPDGKYVKIGFSKAPARRLQAEKPAARLIGSVPGTREVEQWLHQRFKSDLAYRKEWFHKSPRLEACIDLFRENTDTLEKRQGRYQSLLGQLPFILKRETDRPLLKRIEEYRWQAKKLSLIKAVRTLLKQALDANGIQEVVNE